MRAARWPIYPKARTVRKHLKALQRRAEFLKERIAAQPEKNLSYDISELKALQWAITKLERTESHGKDSTRGTAPSDRVAS